jgi:hypothetical protein
VVGGEAAAQRGFDGASCWEDGMSKKHQVVLLGGAVLSALISATVIWLVLYLAGVL